MRKVLAAALLLLLTTGTAFAAYAYPTPPAAWGGTAGAWTYGGTAAANAPWINGSAAAQVTTNVGGRAITVPATMRMAANAPSVVARAILSNPAMRLAPMLAWAAAGLLVYDAATGLWNREVPNTGMSWRVDQTAVSYPSSQAACEGAAQASLAGSQYSNLVVTVTPANATEHWCSMTYTLGGNNYTGTDFTLARGTNTCPSGNCSPSLVPATQEDFDALPQAVPMPDAVARAADDVMPLPQLLPEIEPVAEPIGTPYERAGEPWQDRAVIEPRNDDSAPWRVDQRIESAPVDEGSPSTPVEQQPTFCESNPSSIACQAMDVPSQQDIAQTTRNVAVTPQSGWGADNAACPAARHITAGGHDIPIPFDMFCTYFGWLRYIIIAFAWLGAGFILLGRID